MERVHRNICAAVVVVLTTLFGIADHARAAALYASNFGNNTITAYDPVTGAFLSTRVTGGPEASGFNDVQVLPNGHFLVAGQLTNNIVEYDANGALVRVFDPANIAGLDSPQGMIIGPDGNLWVASATNDTIVKYDLATGNFGGTFANLGASGHVGPIDLAFGVDGNLYVTGFDVGEILRIDGTTGAILGSTLGPPGLGFGPAAFGPDGLLYLAALDLSTFGGSVLRYSPVTNALSPFISEATGGLGAAGGLVFGPSGNLLLANLAFDESFNDIGSTILRFNGQTGAFLGTLVTEGNGLNIPFFLVADSPTPVPEASTMALVGIGMGLLRGARRSSSRSW